MEKMSKMKTALIVAASLMLCGAVLQGAERGFDDVVRAISDQLHARPVHIPFFGLVNFAAFVAHPAGVKHLGLAVFENLNLDDHAAGEVAKAIQRTDGGWRPFLKVHGHSETVLIYMAPERNDCKLLLVAIESGEVTVVDLKLNPESLQVWLDHPEDSALHHRDGRED
jgi:hypothetical protein